jgi:branched-chain amino acid transport system ATP-binding protein
MTASIVVRDLSVRRGIKQALAGVSLTLEPGKITALLGPNGAGKSTLVLTLAGVLPATSGTMKYGGTNLVGLPPEQVRSLGIAAVPEGHHTLSLLSVNENLLAAGPMLSMADLRSSVNDVYRVFPELAEREGQIAGSMSGGQQQMLALAQALVARPKYILADEMSLGLAPVIVRRLMNVVSDLARKGVGILLIEQFTHVALSVADEVHVISQGKFSYSGGPDILKANPEILHSAYLGRQQVEKGAENQSVRKVSF